MRIQWLLLLFFGLYSSPSMGQKDWQVEGRVVDTETDRPLPYVNIYNLNSQTGTTTDESGYFKLKTGQWPAQLQFSHIGYETLALWLDKPGDQWLDIRLHPYFSTLPDVVVSAQPVIETLTKPTYTVRDYSFVEERLLLLTLPGMREGNSLVLIDEEGEALVTQKLNKLRNFEFLHKSCTGRIHLVTHTQDIEIQADTAAILIGKEYPRKTFSRLVEPCVAATDSLVILRHRYCIGQLLEFRGYEKYSDREFSLAIVANDENLERRYSEELAPTVGFIDMLDISWEEKQAMLTRVLENELDAHNVELLGWVRLFYQPIDAPLFQIGSQLLLFNHLADKLAVFDPYGKHLSDIPINYHKDKKWDQRILADAITGNVYTAFNHPEGKLIRQINTTNGTLGPPVLIKCVYVENMKVNNGHLYYLESGPTTSDYNRVLRKVRL